MAQTLPPTEAEPGFEIGQLPPIPTSPEQPSLFLSPSMLETSHLPMPSETGRQLRSGTSLGQSSVASSPQSRGSRPKAAPTRRPRNLKKVQDIYGFGSMEDDAD